MARASRRAGIVLLLGVVALAALLAVIHFSLLDGLHGEVLALVLGDETEYASGFTDASFRKIQTGMTIDAVHQVVFGSPWLSSEPGEHGALLVGPMLRFSWQGNKLLRQRYRERAVVLDADGRVAEIRTGYRW